MIGEFLALGSAFAFAFGNVAIAKGAVSRSGESGVLLSVMMTGFLSALAWLVAGLPARSYAAEPLIWVAVGWFAASGLLATVWGRLTLYRAIEYAGVVRASTVRRLTPFFSVVLAWMVLRDHVSAAAGAGMFALSLVLENAYLRTSRPCFSTTVKSFNAMPLGRLAPLSHF